MGRNFFKLFGMSDATEEEKEFVVVLPGNINEGGEFNKNSGTWAYIKKWAEEELDKCRKKNDMLIPIDKTDVLRGEIKALKKLISLPEIIVNK